MKHNFNISSFVAVFYLNNFSESAKHVLSTKIGLSQKKNASRNLATSAGPAHLGHNRAPGVPRNQRDLFTSHFSETGTFRAQQGIGRS